MEIGIKKKSWDVIRAQEIGPQLLLCFVALC